MARPVETTAWNADPTAEQFVEDWSGSTFAKWRQDYGPAPAGLAVQADDGQMGTRFARCNVGDGGFQATARAFFDHTRAFVWRWRQRVPSPNNEGAPWQGQGVILSGEMRYGDGAADGYGIFGSSVGGAGVVDIEESYDPATHLVAMRYRPLAGTWSGWTTRARDLSSGWWPVQWWSGGLTDNGLDLGRVALVGASLWGAQDGYNFEAWTLVNADVREGIDSSGIAAGIVAGTGLIRYQPGVDAATTVPLSQSFGATGPTVGIPFGSAYKEFWFDLGGYSVGSAHIRLRNAADDTLISDTYLSGNAAGLETVATALPGSGGAAHIQRVSLAGVPTGVQVYVDFQGQTAASGLLVAQPRLAGAWVSFGPIPLPGTLPAPGVLTVGQSASYAVESAGGQVRLTLNPMAETDTVLAFEVDGVEQTRITVPGSGAFPLLDGPTDLPLG
jgi:hypothetical protein